MVNFVANTKLPPTVELRRDGQGARVLRQVRDGCSIRAAWWEQGPRVPEPESKLTPVPGERLPC